MGRAIAGGLAVLVAGIALLFLGEQVKPSEKIVPEAPAHSFCKPGWTPNEAVGDHTVSFTCHKDGVTVILRPDGSFNLAEVDGQFILDEEAVPGW